MGKNTWENAGKVEGVQHADLNMKHWDLALSKWEKLWIRRFPPRK
jgi:hypothetical protein